MKNKGFTLIEMLAVLLILSLIVIIAFPNIISSVKKADSKIDEATTALIFSGTRNLIEDNKNTYPLTLGNIYCLTINNLIDKGYVIENLQDVEGNSIDKNKFVSIKIQNNKYEMNITNSCTEIRG